MALSKMDKWLIGVLIFVFLVGGVLLITGALLVRTLGRNLALPEGPGVPPSLEWEKTFSRGDFSIGEYVLETSDGGMVVLSRVNTHDQSSMSDIICLFKLDSGGGMVWEEFLYGYNDTRPRYLLDAGDGGFLVMGETTLQVWKKETEESRWIEAIDLFKIDCDGREEWKKVLSKEYTCGAGAGHVAPGGYILAGSCHAGEDSSALYLFKIDPAGELLWEKAYLPEEFGGPVTGDVISDRMESYLVQPDPRGGYLVVAGRRVRDNPYEDGREDIFLVKIDESGEIQHQTMIEAVSRRFSDFALSPTGDGGTVFFGEREFSLLSLFKPSIHKVKIDRKGRVEWEKEYSRFQNADSIKQLGDGGYLALSSILEFFPFPVEKTVLFKTDAAGDLQWVKTLGGDDLLSIIFGYHATEVSDGGFVITGSHNGNILVTRLGLEE